MQFYHELRNKLYHQGNGITIPSDKAQGYAALVVDLLNILLAVDLSDKFKEPQRQAEKKAHMESKKREIQRQRRIIKGIIAEVETLVQAAVETIDPRLVLPSFIKQFNDICKGYEIETGELEVGAMTVFTSKPKSRIEFAQNVADLLDRTVVHPEIRSKLIRRERYHFPLTDVEIEIEKFAVYLLRDNYPDIFSVYFGILDILAGDNEWKAELDFAAMYPSTISMDDYDDEEQVLGFRVADAGERIRDLKRIGKEISDWTDQQKSPQA